MQYEWAAPESTAYTVKVALNQHLSNTADRQKKLYVKTVELQACCIGLHWIKFIVSKTNLIKQMELIF